MHNFFMRFPKGKKKALTLSYDDGVKQDIRLIEIMQQNGLKGTFNINSGLFATEEKPRGNRMTKEQATALYTDSGMEVAVHGVNHLQMEQLPAHLCVSEALKDRENLEEQFHTIIRGMAYPYGSYSDQVVECLRNAGIVYSRTVRSTGNFQIPRDWLRLEPTCHHDDKRLMELAQKFVEEDCKRASWLFYVWGHSYEFDTKNNWHVIEEFAEYIGNREDVWYATNMEIYDYVKAYESLIYSANGSRVYNPTGLKVYFEYDQVVYEVGPGEEVCVAG